MEFLVTLKGIRAVGEHTVLVCFGPAKDENACCHLTTGCDTIEVAVPKKKAESLRLGHDYVCCFVEAPDKKSS